MEYIECVREALSVCFRHHDNVPRKEKVFSSSRLFKLASRAPAMRLSCPVLLRPQCSPVVTAAEIILEKRSEKKLSNKIFPHRQQSFVDGFKEPDRSGIWKTTTQPTCGNTHSFAYKELQYQFGAVLSWLVQQDYLTVELQVARGTECGMDDQAISGFLPTLFEPFAPSPCGKHKVSMPLSLHASMYWLNHQQ